MNFKLYGKVLETSVILLIIYFSLDNYNDFMIFYKNFQNKNLLFKTTEYQTLKSLHEKILLYNNYLEKSFIKPKERKEEIFSNENNLKNENFYDKNYLNDNAFNEKSLLNVAFYGFSEFFKIENYTNKFSLGKKTINKANLKKRNLNLNSSKISNDTELNLINETYFIYNIEDRAFNAILSHHLSEIIKSYLPLVIFFLLKVL